jgi:hypothetical protein
VGTAASKPGCLGSFLGVAGLLAAVVVAPIGLMSITSDPLRSVGLLVMACVGGVFFGRALLADRRWREYRRSIVRRHPAAGRGRRPYVNAGFDVTQPGDRIPLALKSFLDDPDGLVSVDIEGPDTFHLHFAMLPSDPSVLVGEAPALSRMGPDGSPGPDARLGLVAIGWAAPASSLHEDFAAEWKLPVDLARLNKFILSTATIYGVDTTQLRTRFGTTPSDGAIPASDAELPPEGTPGVPALARWDARAAVRRFIGSPIGTFGLIAIAAVYWIAGRDGRKEFIMSIPSGVLFGVVGIWSLLVGVRYMERYLRTADPVSSTRWSALRSRNVTTYQRHAWWGIFGAILVLVGIASLLLAVSTVT